MKKILFISTALLASLTACEDYNDQFNLGSQISDVKKGVAIKLAAADYATVANNAPIRKSLCRKILKTVHM